MNSTNLFGLTIGIVKNNADPAQHGRLQVYVPAWDDSSFHVDDLPWCWYVSPIGGSTVGIKAGREEHKLEGISTYGMWAIPKTGAQVLVACLDGNPKMRIWLGCMYMPEMNRTLPAGIDGVTSELDDTGQFGQHVFQHLQENLTDAGLWKTDAHWRTRGGYARSVSHPSNKNRVKPTDNGYAPNPNEPAKADSQIWCFTTPGRHYIEMSDVKEESRIRLKTSEGSQVILDDTNERIYISTAKGRNYIELDETSGKVYVYSDSKVNVSSRNDINLYSGENINIVANKRINIKSEERAVVVQGKHDVRLVSTEADVMLTASRDIQLKTEDGPQASPEPGITYCETADRHGNPGGKTLIHNWPEKGGSATSSVKIDSAQGIEALAQAPIKMQSIMKISLRSSGAILQTAPSLNFSCDTARWTAKATGLRDSIYQPVKAAGGADTAEAAAPLEAAQAEEVTDRMVRPQHESWIRDEDEVECPTVRGPNYQG